MKIATWSAAVLLGVGLVGGCQAGGSATGDGSVQHDAVPESSATASPSAAPTVEALSLKTPRPTSAPTRAKTGSALALLATLPVKGRAPMTGYGRAEFGAAWADTNRNGCDTRNDILRRDLLHKTFKSGTGGCVVLTGDREPDPYTARVIHFVRGGAYANELDIDHVVALGNAWATGAGRWSDNKRLALANDPLNLLAVDPSANRQKGDGDAATWLPPYKAFRCSYVARQVAVKAKYHLWVTRAEHDAIARVLSACPGQAPPTGGNPTTAPISSSTSSHTQSTTHPTSVKVYANCSELNQDYPHGVGRPGAVDHTSGKPVTDFTVNEDVYDANTGRDRDKDGIACERA